MLDDEVEIDVVLDELEVYEEVEVELGVVYLEMFERHIIDDEVVGQ